MLRHALNETANPHRIAMKWSVLRSGTQSFWHQFLAMAAGAAHQCHKLIFGNNYFGLQQKLTS
jgi:hypothetical protein